jgi:hypothetical protein
MDDKYRKEYEKQREQFRNHRQDNWNKGLTGATGAISYDPTYHEQTLKVKKPKPDPATVEAELQLEEQLWAS